MYFSVVGGRLTEVRLKHSENAEPEMLVTPSSIMISVIWEL